MAATRTGTVVAQHDGDMITIALNLTAAEYVDLLAGLAWIDVLGGFGAWRTILPLGDQPARLAGQFNLRRTYDTTRESAGGSERTQAAQSGPATPVAEDPRGAATALSDGANETGSGDLREERALEADCGCASKKAVGMAQPAGDAEVERLKRKADALEIFEGLYCTCGHPKGKHAGYGPCCVIDDCPCMQFTWDVSRA